MKQRLSFLIKVYIWFMFIFTAIKPIFLLYHYKTFSDTPFTEYLNILRHGFEMDMSVASYIIVPLIIITALSVWSSGKWVQHSIRIYLGLITAAISIIAISDLELYSYWGFRIDATPLFYLAKPSEAFASVEWWKLVIFPIIMVLFFIGTWAPLHIVAKDVILWKLPRRRIFTTALFIMLAGAMIIPIRGGVGTSTMSVGRAFYSSEARYNNAAVNPVFSLLHSITHENDFSDYAQYMDKAEADELLAGTREKELYFPDKDSGWIKKERPNIIMVILESFSLGASTTADGKSVMPNLKEAGTGGIVFTNFYANSFRTDRGLFSIIDGFPALPTTSVMKYPEKMQNFPSLTKHLKEEGYHTSFLYGGDADFTNMRSFFVSGGVDEIISDKDLSVSRLKSKWGANDEETFSYITQELKSGTVKEPFFKIFLTLSSHEPFDVPYNKFTDKYLNSVAYTDSCIGVFLNEFKKTRLWDNTIVIFVADHGVSYLLEYDERGEDSHRIPMIWCGGAIKQSRIIDTYASQSDIPATLLSQLKVDYSKFGFSKNIADKRIDKFAYYTYPNGFGYIEADNKIIFDCDAGREITKQGSKADSCLLRGKALLQKLYDTIR